VRRIAQAKRNPESRQSGDGYCHRGFTLEANGFESDIRRSLFLAKPLQTCYLGVMSIILDPLQALVLDRCREWADGFTSVRSVSVFGSVGRGDYHAKSDIDLYFDFDTSNPAEFGRSQQALTRLQIELAQATDRPVSLHYELFGDQNDDASKAVNGPDAVLVISRGKARLLNTPKSPGSPRLNEVDFR